MRRNAQDSYAFLVWSLTHADGLAIQMFPAPWRWCCCNRLMLCSASTKSHDKVQVTLFLKTLLSPDELAIVRANTEVLAQLCLC